MTATAAFLENLARSRLIAGEKLEQIQRSAAQLLPAEIAAQLVEQSLLSKWQARNLLAGQTAFFLGKYELLDELGRGGMGAVFKARKAPIGRIVALKIMAEKLVGNDAAVARFHREIRAAAALNHPHVVSAFDAESVSNTHFLVMEYVEGESLHAVLQRERRLPVAMACDYIRQAALGLAHAHEQGMVHRDIKPHNLLVTRDSAGRPLIKILDLGLARFTSAGETEAELTTTGQVMGTPDYMSPEQCRNSRSVDIRSDIYSLGCTLFRALTGRVPFQGDSVVEKLMARNLEEAPRLETFLGDAPAGLPEVVARMLARDPAGRYQTPQEVAHALEPFADLDRALPTRILSAPPPAERRATSELVPMEKAADLDVSNLLRVLAHEAENGAPSETLADRQPTILQPSPVEQATRLPDKRGLRGRVEERSRADRRVRQTVAISAGTILLLIAAAWGWERAGRTRLVVDWPVDERQGAELEVDGGVLTPPRQGDIPVVMGSPGTRKLRFRRAGYEPIEAFVDFARGETRTYRPEWKPTIATKRRRNFESWRQDVLAWLQRTGERLPAAGDSELATLWRRFAELRLQFLNTSDQRKAETLWRKLPSPLDLLPQATDSPTLDPVLAPIHPPQFVTGFGDSRFKYPIDTSQLFASPDGSLVATGSSGHLLYLWDLASGRLRIPPVTDDFFGGYLAFSPDSKSIAWLSREVVVWSIEDNSRTCTVPIDAAHVGSLVWTPRTNRIAVSDSKVAQIHVFDAVTGHPVSKLEGAPGELPFGTLVSSPDGQLLGTADATGRTRIWNLGSGEGFELPPGSTQQQSYLAFSPDSRQVARGAAGTPISIWDVEQRQLVLQAADFPVYSVLLAWNSDGIIRAMTQNPFEASVWNLTDGRRQAVVASRSRPHLRGTITADGKRLITSGIGGEVQVWDAETGEELVRVPPAYTAADIDPLGEWIALGTNARTIEIRDLAGGSLLNTLTVTHPPSAIAVSPDRRFLAVTPQFEQHKTGQITIFDGNREIKSISDLSHPRSPVFTPDGSLLIVADWTHVAAWSTSDWQLKFKRPLPNPPRGYTLAQVAITSDNRRLIVTAWDDRFGGVVGFSLPDGQQRYVDSIGPVTAITAAGDPRAVVLNLGSQTRWYDAEKGKSLGSVQVSPDVAVYSTSLACSPDGSTFVRSSSDGQLTLLTSDLLISDRQLSMGSTQLIARWICYAPDGRHVITLNSNGTLYILRLESWPPVEKSR